MDDHERRIDLVLEGGGVKGIGLVGALAVLEDRGYEPQRIAGTSAGAITAALSAAGYKPAELLDILMKLDFTDFMDEGPEDRIPLLGRPLSVWLQQGVFEGEAFLKWIEEMLAAQGVHTFADLVYEDTDDVEFRHRLQVIASDITGGRMLILPRDAPAFGVEPDDLPVAEAVRMSMGIPIFFEPWKWNDRLIVDGGVLSNFPVFLFDAPEGKRRWYTFGLLLAEDLPKSSAGQRIGLAREEKRRGPAIVEFGKRLVQTMLEAHDRRYVENDSYLRTIMIDTLGVGTTDFSLSEPMRRKLHQSGRDAAEKFLDERWDPARFEAVHDAGSSAPSRSELLSQALPEEPFS